MHTTYANIHDGDRLVQTCTISGYTSRANCVVSLRLLHEDTLTGVARGPHLLFRLLMEPSRKRIAFYISYGGRCNTSCATVKA
jgi:hypothetical protein